MKNSIKIAFAIFLLATAGQQAFSQGFVNLNFEDADTSGISPGVHRISTSAGLPGWTAYAYGDPLNTIFYNDISLGAPVVSLQGPGSQWPALQGQYSVGLQSSDPGAAYVSAIAQTGQLPPDALSINFLFSAQSDAIQLSFAGQLIPLIQIGTGTGYSIFGGDISAFAGQTGELRFTSGVGPFGHGGFGFLDDIQFSSSPVPEPGTLALGALGALLLGVRLGCKKTGCYTPTGRWMLKVEPRPISLSATMTPRCS